MRLAHQIAFENPKVNAQMVDATEFPNLAEKHNVHGVPKTVVNGTSSFEGAVPENVFVENVIKA